jgi:phage/plasmid-associated DNA primase
MENELDNIAQGVKTRQELCKKCDEEVKHWIQILKENENEKKVEFKIDKDLKSKLDNYKSVFMCILLDYYKLYRLGGLTPPIPVLNVTKKYENDNNIIKQFIDENIILGDKQDFITKDKLKDIYKSDYTIRSTFGKFTIFIKQLENALCTEFKLDKKNIAKIMGWRIKIQELEDNSDTE